MFNKVYFSKRVYSNGMSSNTQVLRSGCKRHFRRHGGVGGVRTAAALEGGWFPPEGAFEILHLIGRVVRVFVCEASDDTAQHRADPVHLKHTRTEWSLM